VALADSIGTAKFLLLVNYRPEYSHQWNSKTYYTQLRLDPLGQESAEEMLSALLGDGKDLSPLKRFIIERTEGTPFFMEEIVQALFEDGVLELEVVARAEVTSEDANFPIEAALTAAEQGPGWRAAEKGKQIIRIIFDSPRTLHRIRLEFCEREIERTQESHCSGPLRRVGHSKKSFASSGISIRKAQPAKSKTMRSNWRIFRSWS
jgi:hypothetical protein